MSQAGLVRNVVGITEIIFADGPDELQKYHDAFESGSVPTDSDEDSKIFVLALKQVI
jgi:hypothetical protein